MASPNTPTAPLRANRTKKRSRTSVPPPSTRRWANRKQTAAYLGVCLRTITDMTADGRITAYRLGGTIRFDLNEIDASFTPSGGGDFRA